MKFHFLLAMFALTITTIDAEAGPFRRRAQSNYQYPSYQQQNAVPAPYTTNYPQYTTNDPPSVTTVSEFTETSTAAGDGLDEVNAKRAASGLRPFVRDDSLTQAARACAGFRAERGLFGHTSNDFAFVPSGGAATSAGCAAYPASYGWMSCCVYDNYTYGGAAWVTGADGKRYMHLFVR
jgi:hypothetical protein